MGKPHKAKWYVRNGRKIFGPLTSPEMRWLVKEGVITADSLVGKSRGRHWAPATKVKGLFRKANADGAMESGLLPEESAEPAASEDDLVFGLLPNESAAPAAPKDVVASNPSCSAKPRRAHKAKWYVRNGRKILGPLTSPEMRKLVEEGVLTANSLVGKSRGRHWAPATKVRGLFRTAAPVPEGDLEFSLLPDESHEIAASEIPEHEGDSMYEVRAEPPPLPSSDAAAQSPTPEAGDLSVPLGFHRASDDGPAKKRRRRKWPPDFSIDLFGLRIDQDTVKIWGLMLGAIGVMALICALVVWCPRRSQRLLESRAVALARVLPDAALVRDDRDGDTLLVRLRLSKRFLQSTTGAHDNTFLSQSDFHLVSDDAGTTAQGFLDTADNGSPWETPLEPGSPFHIKSSLPTLGDTKVEVVGSLEQGHSPSGASAVQGGLTANISGDMKGQVTVSPIAVRTFAPRAMRGGVGGCLIEGHVAGNLSDGTPVSFEYTGDSCKITWPGSWLGFGARGGSLSVSLVERWYDKTVDVYCIFSRPGRASTLSVRYKDAPPISLSPSLAGPPK